MTCPDCGKPAARITTQGSLIQWFSCEPCRWAGYLSTESDNEGGGMGKCQWFLRCVRPAAGNAPHPVLGNVPICPDCADRFDLEVTT